MVAHQNNFGFMRLVLASLVIVGHAPEMVDGNRMREPLTVLTQTVSLGELAVGGFFLLSGYLITSSMINTADVVRYAQKRILRIYPAFIIAFLLSTFALGPLVGADVTSQLPNAFLHMVMLWPPVNYPGQFPGMAAHPFLNGAMWTIAYEFRCYILVAALWSLGILQRRRMMLALTLVTLLIVVMSSFAPIGTRLQGLSYRGHLYILTGNLLPAVRLISFFLVGSSLYLFRDKVLPRLTGSSATLALIVGAILIRDEHVAQLALATCGAAVLFWLALKASIGPFQKINDKWDISYGVYLYGWPIAIYLRWAYPTLTPLELAGATLPLAALAGAASYWGLEKWVKVPARKPALPERAPTSTHADLLAGR
jgi:peptidoglycan/LPS O-acetylase OafA/YrhL